MTVKPDQLLDLIRRLTDPSAERRTRAADEATDWAEHLGPAEGKLVTGVLATAAACEHDPACLEAQLNAIIQLGRFADSETVGVLCTIKTSEIPETLSEHLDAVLND
ncbi:hypothetical protein [Streptomyces bambusae]|uniref:HEAT repeat domain-containing protein n=1 Tax=Streptomyces bambusae TaxID=1550616 RepID=A0ABS6Z233_9ACTN|nr:hypothetical protein [Streptomyces bambusae]MBW5481792.1 hypothetical protein [Streptomyces bambusae]